MYFFGGVITFLHLKWYTFIQRTFNPNLKLHLNKGLCGWFSGQCAAYDLSSNPAGVVIFHFIYKCTVKR